MYLPLNKIIFLQNLPMNVSKDQPMVLFSQHVSRFEWLAECKDIVFVEFLDDASATVAT
ncbi:hypothetical protein GY45DRAFT_1375869 [Cubamyces sp. BRFM 1775]|nr:hypothetical protein GY45DRAFT_1375869 [Cubamyces sp. BRFM 1775]